MSKLLLLMTMMMLTPFDIGLGAADGSMFVTSSNAGRRWSSLDGAGHRQPQPQRRHEDPRRCHLSLEPATVLFGKKKAQASQDRNRFDVSDYIQAVRNVVPPKKSSSGGRRGSSSPPRPKRVGDGPMAGAVDSALFQPKTNVPDLKAQLSLSRDGHACIRGLLRPDSIGQRLHPLLVDYARRRELHAWRQKVEVAANVDGTVESQQKAVALAQSCQTSGECCRVLSQLVGGDVPIPFLQFFNCWRDLRDVRDLAERLAPVAAAFLDVKTVRLYQDSVFSKRQSDGPTPWHADARMAPFDTSLMVTAWIPLQNVQTSGLVFASKSHADYGLPYWRQQQQQQTSRHGLGEVTAGKQQQYGDLSKRYSDIVDYMPLTVGDVTFHAGWTLHCADGAEERMALAITYVDAAAPIRPDLGSGDDEDAWSYRDWISDVPAGTSNWDHPLAPKLGRRSTASSI